MKFIRNLISFRNGKNSVQSKTNHDFVFFNLLKVCTEKIKNKKRLLKINRSHFMEIIRGPGTSFQSSHYKKIKLEIFGISYYLIKIYFYTTYDCKETKKSVTSNVQ